MVATKRLSGFTLLELLVALAIASLIMLAVTATLFSLYCASETASQGMEQRRSLRTTLDLLRRELSSTLYQRTDKQLRFLVEDRDYYGKQASSLSFTTLAPPLEGAVSDQLTVQYKSAEAGNTITLTRASRDFFQLETSPQNAYPVMDRLEGFLVECYDGSKWVKSWDTTLTNALPRQVRITLSLLEGDKTVSYQVVATPRIAVQ